VIPIDYHAAFFLPHHPPESQEASFAMETVIDCQTVFRSEPRPTVWAFIAEFYKIWTVSSTTLVPSEKHASSGILGSK
jgi:hypothetical protein